MHEQVLVSENELILKAQRGDLKAFEQLVRLHDKRVMSIALTHTRDEDDAKDIYQDVFLRVYRSLPKFTFKSEFSTWIYRIVTNACLTFHSQRKKHKHASFDEVQESTLALRASTANLQGGSASIDGQNSGIDLSMQLHDGLKSLSPAQRMVFTLKHFHGYKIREIAGLMNCAEGTVKKHLFIAVGRLRKQLKDIQ